MKLRIVNSYAFQGFFGYDIEKEIVPCSFDAILPKPFDLNEFKNIVKKA